jgi:hypothetical protein
LGRGGANKRPKQLFLTYEDGNVSAVIGIIGIGVGTVEALQRSNRRRGDHRMGQALWQKVRPGGLKPGLGLDAGPPIFLLK